MTVVIVETAVTVVTVLAVVTVVTEVALVKVVDEKNCVIKKLYQNHSVMTKKIYDEKNV